MASAIITEIQAVVDRLQQEGHTVATRLENALHELESFFTKDASDVVAEVKADADQVKSDAAPLVAEVAADGKKVASDAEAEVQADLGSVLAGAKK